MKKPIDLPEQDADQHLFERHVQDCVILKQNKVRLNPMPFPQKIMVNNTDSEFTEENSLEFYRNHESLAPVSSNSQLMYRHPSVSKKILRNLQKGQYTSDVFLDLHGYTELEAKSILQAFLTDCLKNKVRCCLLIHGKGQTTDVPILKNCLNHWLRQLPFVLAFCSATNQHGGTGALYLLLKSDCL